MTLPHGPGPAVSARSVLVQRLRSSELSHSYLQSGSSGCFRSHNGRLLRTSGRTAKLYSGGGDDVAHSSVHASHGSLPAGSPFRSERIMLHTRQATPPA